MESSLIIRKLTSRTLLCLMLFFPGVAQASLVSMDLSIEISDATAPEGDPPWLNATFNGSGGTVTLMLSTTNLTDEERVKEWMFNLDPGLLPDYDATDLVFSAPTKTGSFDDPTISLRTDDFKADGDGYFDIKIKFKTKKDDSKWFGAGDAVLYTITGIPTLAAESFDFISEPNGGQGEYKTVAHVQSIGQNNNDSGWVATPEPATLGVLLIGSLALLRKRRA